MRAFITPLFLLAAGTAVAGDNSKQRMATKTEIQQLLNNSQKLEDGRNGYQYRSGDANGFKISDGKICVQKTNRTAECLTVYSDGKRLEIIDRRGNRDFLN